MKFEQHTIESAAESVKADLQAAQAAYGSIPNLYRGLANNPASLKMYLAFNEVLKDLGSLTPVEQQVVYLTVSAENACTYCVAAHSALASMVKIPQDILAELRDQKTLSDPKLNALRNFTLAEMEHRGWVPEQALNDFVAAGRHADHFDLVIGFQQGKQALADQRLLVR